MLLFLACSGVSLSILNFQCYPKSDYAEKRRSPLFSNHASFFPCRNPRVFVNSPNPPHPALAVASLHSSRLEVGVNVSSYSGTLSYHSIRGSDDSLYDSSIVQTNRDGSASSRNKRSSPARVLMIMDCECRHRLLIGRSKRNRMSPYLILYGLAKFETQDRWSKSQIDFFNEVDNFPLQIEFGNIEEKKRRKERLSRKRFSSVSDEGNRSYSPSPSAKSVLESVFIDPLCSCFLLFHSYLACKSIDLVRSISLIRMLCAKQVSLKSRRLLHVPSVLKATLVTASQLRNQFLGYYEKKGHLIYPGSSVIPEDDPSLLFVNAGMNQFKKYYLGEAIPYVHFSGITK